MNAALAAITWSMGFDYFLFGLQILDEPGGEPRHFVVNGYPESWRRRYLEKSYIYVDPTVAHCLTKTTPLVWGPEQVAAVSGA
jgi:LuxR family transcriptional regulator